MTRKKTIRRAPEKISTEVPAEKIKCKICDEMIEKCDIIIRKTAHSKINLCFDCAYDLELEDYRMYSGGYDNCRCGGAGACIQCNPGLFI